MENADKFVNLNINAETITSLFVEEENASKTFDKVEAICDAGNKTHNAQCDENSECKGGVYYIRLAYRAYLINHPEIDEMERLAITAGVFHTIGSESVDEEDSDNPIRSMINKSKDILIKNLLVKVNGGTEPTFNEFQKIMKEVLIKS